MNHQDWKPIVLKDKKEVTGKDIITKPKLNQPKIKEDAEGNIIVKKVSKEMAQQVVQGRISKKMSQIDLAKACNIDTKILNEIEKGNCVYNAEHFNKICKTLNIKIERNTL
jgi:ribosome-binding protein aMBF1 (putative translation factor)